MIDRGTATGNPSSARHHRRPRRIQPFLCRGRLAAVGGATGAADAVPGRYGRLDTAQSHGANRILFKPRWWHRRRKQHSS